MTHPPEHLIIAALVKRLGGRVELTDIELAETAGDSMETWRDIIHHRTIIIHHDLFEGELQDLGEATIEPDDPPAIEAPADYYANQGRRFRSTKGGGGQL